MKLCLALNWGKSKSGDQANVVYPFISIAPRYTLICSASSSKVRIHGSNKCVWKLFVFGRNTSYHIPCKQYLAHLNISGGKENIYYKSKRSYHKHFKDILILLKLNYTFIEHCSQIAQTIIQSFLLEILKISNYSNSILLIRRGKVWYLSCNKTWNK